MSNAAALENVLVCDLRTFKVNETLFLFKESLWQCKSIDLLPLKERLVKEIVGFEAKT